MNEGQWLACDEPRQMIAYLRAVGQASERKCRLLTCALAQSLWADLPDVRGKAAVEAAEAFADGCLGADALREAAAWPVWPTTSPARRSSPPGGRPGASTAST